MSDGIENNKALRAIAISLLSCTLGGSLAHDFNKSNLYYKPIGEKHSTDTGSGSDHEHAKERRRKFLKLKI